MGVAMIAICLPTLRPVFQGWSLESIVKSFRSAISLRSMGSGHKSSLSTKENVARSESETAITGPQESGLEYGNPSSLDVEAYAMGAMGGKKANRVAGPAILRRQRSFILLKLLESAFFIMFP